MTVITVPIAADATCLWILTVEISVSKIDVEDMAIARDDAISAVLGSLKIDD